jgi:hypothetical protein
MGHPPGLTRLPLPAGNKSETASVIGIGHPVTFMPKFRGDAMIDHISQHVGSLAVLNEPKGITAELKVIPALVNAV